MTGGMTRSSAKSHVHSLRACSPIWASEASLARSRETFFTRPNRRACSQAKSHIVSRITSLSFNKNHCLKSNFVTVQFSLINVAEHCRKLSHLITDKRKSLLIIQIQEGQKFFLAATEKFTFQKRLKKMLSIRIREKIMPTRNKPQKINMRVTTSQYETSSKNTAHLLSRNLPAALLYTAYAR